MYMFSLLKIKVVHLNKGENKTVLYAQFSKEWVGVRQICFQNNIVRAARDVTDILR